jgi:protein-arginine deiminase
MKHVAKIALGTGLGVALLAWTVPVALADTSLADLRVDANRDGRVDVSGRSDERGEDQASVGSGALFLPNLDDDARRCRFLGPDGDFLPEAEIVACRDGADTVVNGAQDDKDLARVRSVPARLPRGTVAGKATVTGPAASLTHLFVKRGAAWQLLRPTDTLTRADLERGLELGIEGTDMIRDAKVWDGRATVTLSLTAGGKTSTDSVTLRAAPVLTHDHTQQAQQIMVSRINKQQATEEHQDPSLEQKSAKLIADLTKIVTGAGQPAPFEFTRFGYMFPQDFFEAMYTSIPGPGGKPHGMRVMFRSHQEEQASWELYEKLRGPDVAVVELAADGYNAGGVTDTLDSTGNMETIPPYSHNGKNYPMGRVIMGRGIDDIGEGGPTPEGGTPSTPGGADEPETPGGADEPATPGGGDEPATPGGAVAGGQEAASAGGGGAAGKELMDPSPAVQTFFKSQGLQDPLLLDSSWTHVQHVDEFIQFLPAKTPRGWRVAIADPDAGMKLLRDAQAAGHGKAMISPDGDRVKTIDDFLNDPQGILARDNTKAARKIAENLELVKRETGVKDDEIVRVPSLFGTADIQFGDSSEGGFESPIIAQVSAAINGVVLAPDRYLSVEQHGSPVINGRNIFADAVTAAYKKAGMKVSFVDGSMFQGGEIHCGSNMLRDMSAPWWRKQ